MLMITYYMVIIQIYFVSNKEMWGGGKIEIKNNWHIMRISIILAIYIYVIV